ncbi:MULTISPECIES: type II secretion system F family protein [Ornithinimicrobium]|uniref:Type II secretion system F family protein n=1 Tax=Ornithinimicrobium kibberense TaxID=282060 RepID=A0ABV5V177_9MICO|nr:MULTISPECIES: type II secretion system F family protein [Ornithinimicrobium]OLT21422.1 hypothetical protein BJF81_02485 [Ornithinimicrobium sp. CNJ-824]
MSGAWAWAPAFLAAVAVLCWPARSPWLPGRATGLRPVRGRGAPGATGPGRPGARSPVLVAEALELMALALRGGGSVTVAVRTVAGVLPGPLGEDLGVVAAALHGGEDPDRAWSAAHGCWRVGARALRLAQAAGVPPGQALVDAAADLRREAVADVEVRAARLGVRLVLPLGLAYLPAFVLITVVPVVLALTRDLTW